MGYYTDYNLDISDEAIKALAERIKEWADTKELIEYKYINAKWHNYAADLIEVSRQFPEDLIIVDGAGEEDEDRWKHYFKGGKHTFCQGRIIYDEFREENLEHYG